MTRQEAAKMIDLLLMHSPDPKLRKALGMGKGKRRTFGVCEMTKS